MRSTRARVTLMNDARRAETLDMLKRLIRDRWGKHTEKKALTPEVRRLLANQQNDPGDSRPIVSSEQSVPERDGRTA